MPCLQVRLCIHVLGCALPKALITHSVQLPRGVPLGLKKPIYICPRPSLAQIAHIDHQHAMMAMKGALQNRLWC